MFDLSAFKKPQAAIHPIRNGGIKERRLDDSALCVAAVKKRHIRARCRPLLGVAIETRAQKMLDLLHDPLRLFVVAGCLHHANGLALALIGAQVFPQPLLVVRNQSVGSVQNGAGAAVVLLELDLVTNLVVAHKVSHIAHPRAPKCINALVVIPDRKNRALGPTHHPNPGVLQPIGVLELIDEQMLKARLVMGPQGFIVPKHFIRAQHQLGKVHHPFTLALLLIELVNLQAFFAVWVVGTGLQIFRALTIVFGTRNEPLDLLWGEALLIDIELLQNAFDGRQLVLGVEDLKGLGQVREFPVRA